MTSRLRCITASCELVKEEMREIVAHDHVQGLSRRKHSVTQICHIFRIWRHSCFGHVIFAIRMLTACTPKETAPSKQSQGDPSKSCLLPKLFSKFQSTTPTQSSSSLPSVSSTVYSRGEIALGEHTMIYPFGVLSEINVESSIPTTPSGMRRTITSQMAYSPLSKVFVPVT